MNKSRLSAAFDFEKLIAGGSAPAPWVPFSCLSVHSAKRKPRKKGPPGARDNPLRARGAGAEPPAISFLRSRARRAIPFKAWMPASAGMTTNTAFAGMTMVRARSARYFAIEDSVYIKLYTKKKARRGPAQPPSGPGGGGGPPPNFFFGGRAKGPRSL